MRYDAGRHPGATDDGGIERGANCQRFAYAVLAHFDRHVPPLRSSELWEDTAATERVLRHEPLDLLLFNRSADPYGAHVGVCLGDGLVLHLCREVGRPAVWPLAAFAARPRYAVLIGAKRCRRAAGA